MKIEEVVRKIETYRKKVGRKNVKIYLVGGAVRDLIMGIEPKDKDYCVSGITQKELESIFSEAKLVGADFPVYLMDIDGDAETEVALVRKERKTGTGYGGFETYTDIQLTIVDDLMRRDLTINAMAMDLETNEIIDPFDGNNDIKNNIIKAVSDAFAEDPLRVYRAARFAARYGFQISEDTLTLMNSLKNELSTLSGERIFLELTKVLKEKKPSVFFESLNQAGVLVGTFEFEEKKVPAHFKEVAELKNNDSTKYESWLTKLDSFTSKNEMEQFTNFFSVFSKKEIDAMAERIKVPKEYKQLSVFLVENIRKVEVIDELSSTEKVVFAMSIMGHPLTKQAESLQERDSLNWFVSSVTALNPTLREKAKKISELAKKIVEIKVTPEEIKEKGLQGKEIGEYLILKRQQGIN